MNATSASAGGMCSASDCAAGFVIGLEMVEVRDAATLNGLYQAVDEAATARRVGAAVIGEGVPSPPLCGLLPITNGSYWPRAATHERRFSTIGEQVNCSR